MTSLGGCLNISSPGQSPCSFWIRAGADGSCGSTAEPYANSVKNPYACIYTHFRNGASLAESFWQSIQLLGEIVCVGDPLMHPGDCCRR